MYITNYQSTKKLVPYIVGQFTILDSHTLKSSDLFPSGVAAVAQAADFPQVLIEHVYTADAKYVPALQDDAQDGARLSNWRARSISPPLSISSAWITASCNSPRCRCSMAAMR